MSGTSEIIPSTPQSNKRWMSAALVHHPHLEHLAFLVDLADERRRHYAQPAGALGHLEGDDTAARRSTATAPTSGAASSAPLPATRWSRPRDARREACRWIADGTSRRKSDRPHWRGESTPPTARARSGSPPFISMMTRVSRCFASTASSVGMPMPWPRNGIRVSDLEVKAGVDPRQLRGASTPAPARCDPSCDRGCGRG